MSRWGAPNPLGGGLMLGRDGAVQQTVYAPPSLPPTGRLQNQPERVSTLTLEVREGGVLRATRTYTPDAERYAFSLTQPERDSVVVWADVELWLIADGGTRAVRVRRGQMRAPLSSAPQTINATALTLTATARTATAVRGALTQQATRLQTTATAQVATTVPGALTKQASPLALTAVARTATVALGALAQQAAVLALTGTARITAAVLGALTRQASSLGLTASARAAAASPGALTATAVRLQVLAALRSGAVEADSVLTFELREGGVLRATRSWTPDGTRQTVDLTTAEQNSVGDWNAVEAWLLADGSRALRVRRLRGVAPLAVTGTPSTLTFELREAGVLRATRTFTPDDAPLEDPYGTATRWALELTEAERVAVGNWNNAEVWLVADGGTRPVRARRLRILTPPSVVGTGQTITASRLQLTATPRTTASVKGAITKTAAVLPLVSTARIGGAVIGAVTTTGTRLTLTTTARSATPTFGAITTTGTRFTLTATARTATVVRGAVTTTGTRLLVSGTVRPATVQLSYVATGARLLLTGTLRPATLLMQVSRAFGVPTEWLRRVTTTASPAAEWGVRILASQTSAVETLRLVTAAPTVPLETLLGLVATRLPATEWRGRVVATAVVPVESRGFALVLQTFAVPTESRGLVVAALEVEAESLRAVAVAWTTAMETLLEVVAAPSPGSESKGSVVAVRLPATEWRGRVVATAVVPVESLALSGVVQTFVVPAEWRTWVTSLHSPEAESKQPIAVSAVLATEHRLRVAQAFATTVEARGGVRAVYLVPAESWGVVVALLIRLLDVRLGVSVLEEVALTPGVATLAALRPTVLDALTWGVAEADDAALDVPTLADLAMATP